MGDIKQTTQVPRPPGRPADAHKGKFGHVLIIGGSRGMAGAVSLSGMAALRSGAGLVTLAVPVSVQAVVSTFDPAMMTIGLPETDDGKLGPDAQRYLLETGWLDAEKQRVAGIGPGLGMPGLSGNRVAHDDPVVGMFRTLMARNVPTVIDADGLNRLAASRAWQGACTMQTIFTPHPGEMARLLGTTVDSVQQNREFTALQAAKTMCAAGETAGSVVILKGHNTVVASGEELYVNTTGNSGMATGGAGDVLTGIVVALLAQGMKPFDAAVLGVYVHGLAGDLAAQQVGQISLTAGDIVTHLPAAFRQAGGV